MAKAKTVKEVLIAGKWIVENVGWCQSAYGRHSNNTPAPIGDRGACDFCAWGALYVVNTSSHVRVGAECILRDTAYHITGGAYGISGYNDRVAKSVADISRLYDAAIEDCP